MPPTKEMLEEMPYKQIVKLAQEHGVYNRKSSKKAALIRKLCSLWNDDEAIENQKPWTSMKILPPLSEVDESNLTSSDNEEDNRRKTFTKRSSSKKKSALTNPPVRQRTFTKDDVAVDDALTEPTETLRSDKTIGDEDSDSANFTQGRIPGEAPVEKLDLNDDPEKGNRRQTFTPDGASKLKPHGDKAVKSTNPPTRQRTFTKDDTSVPENTSDGQTAANSEEALTNSPPKSEPLSDATTKNTDPPKRQRTFTKEDSLETESSGNHLHAMNSDEPVARGEADFKQEPPTPERRLPRRSTFTFSPAAGTPRTGATPKISSLATPSLCSTEVATTPKTPNGLTQYQPPPATAPPIEKLSVFERLSVKLSSSARRSLVASERKSVNQTPTSAKRSQLASIRNLRLNRINPKSLRLGSTRADTAKTPTQPVMKQQSSSGTKNSSVRKLPNFSEIHKRNFAKMESLLENKNRLRDRANILFSPPRLNQMSSSKPNGTSKRGEKASLIPVMKKATKDRLKTAVATKSSVVRNGENHGLKGVRTNKRFQLQLNAIKQTML